MDIRPIRSEADYRAALNEVERLWQGEPGTPEGDRVEVLSTLIEAYEARHHPIAAPDRQQFAALFEHRIGGGGEVRVDPLQVAQEVILNLRRFSGEALDHSAACFSNCAGLAKSRAEWRRTGL